MSMQVPRAVLSLTLLVLLVAATGCGDRSPESDRPEAPEPMATPILSDQVILGAHRFLPVGKSISLRQFGALVEVVSVDDGALAFDSGSETLRCERGGRGFARIRYRDVAADKNQIQTLGVVCIDEIGDCAALPRLAFDFERFLEEGRRGEANYLAQGDGSLYGVCLRDGRYRLQQAVELPPLMYRVIDALGEGPYSLADADFEKLRRSAVVSYSGEESSPSWFSSVSRELTTLSLNGDGSVTISEPEDCAAAPGCSYSRELVHPGDILSINFGIPGNAGLQGLVDGSSDELVDSFVAAHIDLAWSTDTARLSPDARSQIVFRLIGTEVMGQLMKNFGALYGLPDSGVRVAPAPYWQARKHIPNLCHPDNVALCEDIERMVRLHERAVLDGWRAEGFSLW